MDELVCRIGNRHFFLADLEARIIYNSDSISSIINCFCMKMLLQFNRSVQTLLLVRRYYVPTRRKGAISVAFVRSSVRPSRPQRIIREPKGLAYQNLDGQFPTFDAPRLPVSRSKGQGSRSSGSLMLIHIVRHIFRTARPTNFKLGVRMEDDNPHHPRAP